MTQGVVCVWGGTFFFLHINGVYTVEDLISLTFNLHQPAAVILRLKEVYACLVCKILSEMLSPATNSVARLVMISPMHVFHGLIFMAFNEISPCLAYALQA